MRFTSRSTAGLCSPFTTPSSAAFSFIYSRSLGDQRPRGALWVGTRHEAGGEGLRQDRRGRSNKRMGKGGRDCPSDPFLCHFTFLLNVRSLVRRSSRVSAYTYHYPPQAPSITPFCPASVGSPLSETVNSEARFHQQSR